MLFRSSIDDAREQLNHIRATVAGLDKRTFERIQRLISKRHEEDVAAATKRAEKLQRKIQSAEWKEQEKEVRKGVESSIRQRPDVMADIFVGSGELAGKKIRQVNPLRSEDLTAEQKVGLPRRYYSAGGIPADAAASLFGFPSGDAMVNALVEYNRDRGELSSQAHLAQVIKAEKIGRAHV